MSPVMGQQTPCANERGRSKRPLRGLSNRRLRYSVPLQVQNARSESAGVVSPSTGGRRSGVVHGEPSRNSDVVSEHVWGLGRLIGVPFRIQRAETVAFAIAKVHGVGAGALTGGTVRSGPDHEALCWIRQARAAELRKQRLENPRRPWRAVPVATIVTHHAALLQ